MENNILWLQIPHEKNGCIPSTGGKTPPATKTPGGVFTPSWRGEFAGGRGTNLPAEEKQICRRWEDTFLAGVDQKILEFWSLRADFGSSTDFVYPAEFCSILVQKCVGPFLSNIDSLDHF